MRLVAMNSPVSGWLFSLYLGAASVLVAADRNWWTLAEMRQIDRTPGATVVAHWAGPEPASPAAAFLAMHLPQTGVRSIVALNASERVRFDGKVTVESKSKPAPVSSLDVEGVRLREYVVLFHTEAGLLRSAFSFDTGEASGPVKIVVTGVAPGTWEVWRNGWVVDIGVVVRPKEGVLYFEERPGRFFVRKLN
jgi:hypothetical protein